MQTLIELAERLQALGKREALQWSNGFRRWTWTYADLCGSAAAFAAWLDGKDFRKGDRIMLWGENRGEWIAAFWGAVTRGIAVVPVDFRFSAELALRIASESQSRLVVHDGSVKSDAIPLPRFALDDLSSLPRTRWVPAAGVTSDDLVEIVYTSGTTGDPKGVLHRHRNICANLAPFQSEIEKYRKWALPFQPIRILNLLPLSHMFGQSMGLFIPPILGGAVAFTSEIAPNRIMHFTRDERISVIVAVPRMLETLRAEVERRFEIPSPPAGSGVVVIAKRWWRYRNIHRAFGWKFWAFVVGGARVDPEIEEFWDRLGLLVVQGYGLTEASPVVAVNHPFDARRGSLGKVVPGQDVVIAPDGEILVRGESVTNPKGEWLHTGDLGSIDAEGRLYFQGRKKDLIVTSEGLNVHPHDVEAVLNGLPEVKDSAVVAVTRNGGEQVHAALILADPKADPESIIERANERLEAHQRIQGWTVWPDADFPRTPSTLKVRRNEIAARIAGSGGNGTLGAAAPQQSALDRLLARKDNLRLSEDLGLSSLDRVEVMSELEARLGTDLDEDRFTRVSTVGDLKQWTQESPRRPRVAATSKARHDWPVTQPARAIRALSQYGLILPVFRHYIPFTVTGLEYLSGLQPPVLFAANHTSHLDTIAIVAALPPVWRRLLAPAMSPEHFWKWFRKRSPAWGLQYFLARILFNAYPLPQEATGVRRALEYTGELVSRGFCPLVYPEGIRTPDGNFQPFLAGVGMMAVRLQIPVVPIRISGLYKVFSAHDKWPKPGPAQVAFGAALRFGSGTAFSDAARQVEQSVKALPAL